MNLIIPRPLQPGDTIGVVCPSSGIDPRAKHRIENACEYLEKTGYKVKLGQQIFSTDYAAGTIIQRVADLHMMFADPTVTAIICATGGNYANHLLRFLDFNLIKQNPKIFVGYSDITVLHYALQTQANLATFYGPCLATQFGEYPKILDYTEESFWRAVGGQIESTVIRPAQQWTDEFLDWFAQEDLTRARNQKKNTGYRWLRRGKAQGEALLACNFSVNRLLGTPYWIEPANKILFLDLVSGTLKLKLLDASLTDLFNAGMFDELAGLVLSRPSGFTPAEQTKLEQRILELTHHTDYPILANFDIGHTDPINTVRYGQIIMLDAETNTVRFN